MDGVCKIGRRQVKQPQLVVVGDGVLGLFLACVSRCERFKRDVCHRLTVDGRRDGHGQKEIVFVGIDLLKPRFPYAVNRAVFKGQPFRRNLERRAFAGSRRSSAPQGRRRRRTRRATAAASARRQTLFSSFLLTSFLALHSVGNSVYEVGKNGAS